MNWENSTLSFETENFPLERNGIRLHLDRMRLQGTRPEKNILLVHGVTYSSHEFDVDYKDYSLVRFLAREGYAAWRLDIAGFGQSGDVDDGFLPDSDYAAEDIRAAVEEIFRVSGQDRVDLLGWSWGTVTAGRCAARHPGHLRRLVLYAPILSGIGYADVTEPFHHNSWEHAADDFQRCPDGSFDGTIADPVVIGLLCSGSWRYDGEFSPNGGRRDICAAKTERLIEPEKITVPTLILCGDRDPYVNYDILHAAAEALPEGSELTVIPGASHMLYMEKPFYHGFQERLIRFLNAEF